ncbi:hypothetical protein [Geoalkalibacter halelectricus]|uniref:hypothetical protein n=1 Tax=Geoalkalibacter halelectricus TaxID=2847045 RepID=UPI003D21E96E
MFGLKKKFKLSRTENLPSIQAQLLCLSLISEGLNKSLAERISFGVPIEQWEVVINETIDLDEGGKRCIHAFWALRMFKMGLPPVSEIPESDRTLYEYGMSQIDAAIASITKDFLEEVSVNGGKIKKVLERLIAIFGI